MKTRWTVGVGITVLGLLGACGSTEPNAGGSEANATGTSACDIVDERTGTKLTAAAIAALSDPVKKLILDGKGCPSSFDEIAKKLEEADRSVDVLATAGSDCAPGCIWSRDCARPDERLACTSRGKACTVENRCEPVGPECRSSARFVSETAQVLGAPDRYRAVISRRCGGRADQDLLMSVFGITAGAQSLPKSVELIGHDVSSGVFNFYAREDDTWKFFGSSKDFVSAGYDCKSGVCESKAAAKTRCAGCHSGGGLVMKELQSPWVHWEGNLETPGVGPLVERFSEQLGRRSTGIELESTVEAGNQDWIATRLETLKQQGVTELLRPLFCTLDTNLQSGAIGNLLRVPSNLFLDPRWEAQGVPVSDADYRALLAENHQRITDQRAIPLVSKATGPVVDTVFGFTYPARVRNGADNAFVTALVAAGIIDDDFIMDVLHVDFTRPLFSKARCALVDFAPKLGALDLNPAAIREGFKANLAGKSGAAAAELLANLKEPNDRATHKADIDRFIAACTARPQKDFLRDAMIYTSQVRNRFRELRIAEFRETLPIDDLPDGDRTFNRTSCLLEQP